MYIHVFPKYINMICPFLIMLFVCACFLRGLFLLLSVFLPMVLCLGFRPRGLSHFHVSMSIGAVFVQVIFRQSN